MALGPGRLEQTNQQHQWDNPTERAPDLGDDRGEVHFLSLVILSQPDSTESQRKWTNVIDGDNRLIA